MYYTIKELRGKALEKALEETRESEFNNDWVTAVTLIDFNVLCGATYDKDGNFVDYSGNEKGKKVIGWLNDQLSNTDDEEEMEIISTLIGMMGGRIE